MMVKFTHTGEAGLGRESGWEQSLTVTSCSPGTFRFASNFVPRGWNRPLG